jgi:hydroxymethylglutaryl-CoA synthase
MIGITSYGAYVPRTRLTFAAMNGQTVAPDDDGPAKAVAWSDEDSVTMAVTAGVECLRGIDRSTVDGVLFASTTYAFREKQAAALVAKALDLPRDVRTADFGGSLRSGMAALRGAFDAVKAGSSRNVLVVASDCRMGAPGSAIERNLGDGAAAFLVGEGNAIAQLEGSFAVADEIVDVWRGDGDPFVHSWEDRFIVKHGYAENLVAAVTGLFEAQGRSAADYAKAALYAPELRSHGTAVRALGLAKEQVQAPLFGQLGNTGAAFAPMLLAAALETAKPGERILVAAYGDGAEALSFEVSEYVEKLKERRGVSWHLARRRSVPSYEKFLKARSLQTTEYVAERNPGLSATIHFRERDEDISLIGQACRQCKAIQFPNQRICETCFAKDDFEPVRLSDRTGKVLTYTFDFFFPTPEPPTIVTVTDVDGARIHMQLVNIDPKDVKLGLPVEFQFRRIHESGGRPNYYWKAVPVPE